MIDSLWCSGCSLRKVVCGKWLVGVPLCAPRQAQINMVSREASSAHGRHSLAGELRETPAEE